MISILPKSRIIFILGGLVLLLAVPLTVIVSQQQQQTKQHASFTNPSSNFSSLTKDYQQLIAEKAIDPAQRILEVSLSYDDSKDPKISLGETRILNGYVPYQFDDLSPNAYILQELDNYSRVLYKIRFEIPNDAHVDPNPDGTITAPVHTELKQVDFIQTIPYFSAANSIMIFDPQGKTIAVKFLEDTPRIDNQPNFRLINGEDIVQIQKTNNNNPGMGVPKLNMNNLLPKLNKVFAQEKKYRNVNIAVIGDKYNNEMDIFRKDALEHMTYFLTFEPLHSRSSQINFILVENNEDLGCNAGSFCNIEKVEKTVSDQGVPYDAIAVIVKGIAHGGAIPPIAAVGSPDIPLAKGTFVHELGHALFRLKDEYTYGPDVIIREVEPNKVYLNCFWGNPPALEWKNLVGSQDYSIGCSTTDWYKPYRTSVMMNHSQHFFNAVSQRLINQDINEIAGDFTEDNVSPQVQFKSPDSSKALSKGEINIKASATDDKGVAYVQLWVDGVFQKTSYISPYDFRWDASAEKEGQHTLQLKAYDVSGNVGQAEKEYRLTTTLPYNLRVILVAGDKGTVDVPSVITIIIRDETLNRAVDSGVIKEIKPFVDDRLGQLKDDFNGSNYAYFVVDPKKYPSGNHKFYAKAYDFFGNMYVSDTITFNIATTPTPTPEFVTLCILYPTNSGLQLMGVFGNFL